MKLVKLIDTLSKDFKESWKIYESSFPLDERRTLIAQKKLMTNVNYNFSSILNDKKLIGMIDEWNLKGFLFVEHLAIKKSFRGMGFGTKLFLDYILLSEQKIVLEVERPNSDMNRKRIRFYERLGLKLNKYDYSQPVYDETKKPIPMFLMTYPDKISKKEYELVKNEIYVVVYKVGNKK